jgi:hypothetical protein
MNRTEKRRGRSRCANTAEVSPADAPLLGGSTGREDDRGADIIKD